MGDPVSGNALLDLKPCGNKSVAFLGRKIVDKMVLLLILSRVEFFYIIQSLNTLSVFS